ncbi:MAG: hypothetical protein KY468_06555, partial [Armatimonadetes bacterium]|nr:hypothetical protein [Armatimonadota bacterium]
MASPPDSRPPRLTSDHPQPAPAPGEAAQGAEGFRFVRAMLLGVLGVVAVCFLIGYAELVIQYIQIGILQLPPVVIGIFLVLTLANQGLGRIARRLRMSPQELTIIYCMMLLGAMVASRGLMEKVLPLLVTPDYFANESNQWQRYFFPNIREWLVPFDTDRNAGQWVSKRFFEGLRYGESVPWGLWLRPLAAWSVLALSIFGIFFCMAALLRRQWVDNERLSFPLVQLPLEMIREEGNLLAKPMAWAGIALSASIFLIRGLSAWYPSVPNIPLEGWSLNQSFTGLPWSAMYWTPVYLSLAAIGFFYLLPTELLFGLWFFFLFARMQDVFFASFGMQMEGMPLYPTNKHIGYQSMGGYFVLVGYLFYSSWPYLRNVFREAFRPGSTSRIQGSSRVDEEASPDPRTLIPDPREEMLPPRAALIGLAVCFTTAVLWAVAAGMALWVAVSVFFIYAFVIALLMARSTAEAGMLMTEASFRPVDVYRLVAPTHLLGPSNMTVLAFLDPALFRDYRGLTLTGFLDGLRLSDGTGLSRRKLGAMFVLAILVAMVVAGAFEIWLPYQKGGITMYGYVYRANNMWGFQDYAGPMAGRVPFDWMNKVWFGMGVGVMFFLTYMRTRFVWWPFHPLGYALMGSWTMIVFWFPCLIAWMLKVLILRYGGMKTYVFLRPMFLGLVLG